MVMEAFVGGVVTRPSDGQGQAGEAPRDAVTECVSDSLWHFLHLVDKFLITES